MSQGLPLTIVANQCATRSPAAGNSKATAINASMPIITHFVAPSLNKYPFFVMCSSPVPDRSHLEYNGCVTSLLPSPHNLLGMEPFVVGTGGGPSQLRNSEIHVLDGRHFLSRDYPAASCLSNYQKKVGDAN